MLLDLLNRLRRGVDVPGGGAPAPESRRPRLIASGVEACASFWRRLVQWRARLLWWALALAAIPLAAGIGYLLRPGTTFVAEEGGAAMLGLLTSTYLIYLLGGPIQEEPGWRGFALPRLQQRLHPVTAALLLGVIHCFWHAPLFLTDEWDTARQEPSQYLAYLILVVSLSFVLSWLYNGSRGSVLMVILGHNGVNWALFTVGALTGLVAASNWPAALGLAGFAIVAIIATRGRLGYTGATEASGQPASPELPREDREKC
ncbi:CPBP family intramembrane glutamic endopeptidase [Microbacterium aurantiacum]|nr:CPBP family intramembrane glutamic endopeptidase [Microbacterium chocolatum]